MNSENNTFINEEENYNEVLHLIKRNEINKNARTLANNSDTLETYWLIGKLIVETQGGKSRAKYGNFLIKEWSNKLTKIYGKGYNYTNLSRFRQFFLIFPKLAPVGQQLNWTIIKTILPIKDSNKRNYYINLCIKSNLSYRDLIKSIKDNSYERLLNKPKNIEIITNNNKSYDIKEQIKNPIIIKLNKDEQILKEKDLQIAILAKLQNFFSELGLGYAFISNEYKIKYKNLTRYIDLLFFNVEINSYVVIELKTRELQEKDKGQILLYMNIIDDTLKRPFHNNTIGIIISKEQDEYIATFVSENNIIPITYKLVQEEVKHICE